MESTLVYLENLAREMHQPEEEVMTQAFRAGLRHLWREHILGQYLQGTISRNDAIETVGIDWVELAERQKEALNEDMTWALEG